MPLLYGWSGSAHAAFDREMIRAIESGRPLRLFSDEFRTPVDAQSAAAGLLHLLGRTSGILHLGGPERVSRFEMGVRIAGVLGAPAQSLIPVCQKAVPMAAARPADVSLVSRRARRLGYDPLPVDEAIQAAATYAGAAVGGPDVPASQP
jgi:dTDP-4-dehydrorhamnose reductase